MVLIVYSSKKVYSLKNIYIEEEIINFSETKSIKYINGLPPLEYIQTFNGNYRKFKSPQGQFVYNMHKINNPFSLIELPLDYSNITDIIIEYNDGSYFAYNYKILYISDFNLQTIFYLNKYFHEFEQFFYDNLNFFDDWELSLDDGNIKCNVDDYNEVNVIFQNTFLPSDLYKSVEFFEKCFSYFDNNKYPIIIIESFNLGGYGDLADFLVSYINLNKSSTIYSSYRYNDEVKKNVAPYYTFKSLNTCEIENSTLLFNSSKIKTDIYEDEIIHKRTQMFDLSSVDENYFYELREKTKYIRKPHEIIIFTDGVSYSATSTFIKETQLKGGAIIVGYDGNPNFKNFDASLSPSAVHSTRDPVNDSLSIEIEKLGFTLSYSIIETFGKLDYEDEENIPLEYQINEIDERVEIYNGYNDNKYQDFIDEALKIFQKYKIRCNPKNKNLLFITEDCIFKEPHLHGGYECGEDGFWSKKCIPSYCDNGYLYDKRENKCIKDICIKEKKFYAKIKNILNIKDIIISLFMIFIIVLIIFIFIEKSKRKRKVYILFIIIINIILIIFLISFY